MGNNKRITIRVSEEEYNRLKQRGNISKVVREYLIIPQGISDAQLQILLKVFDMIWDELPPSKQKKIMKDELVKKAGEILNAIRNS